MLIPEVTLYNTIEGFLATATADWNVKTDKTKTVLHDLFATDDNDQVIQINTYNYFQQAQAVLLRNNSSTRKLEVNIGYNMSRSSMPTIHILMPSESKGRMDVLGDIEGTVEIDPDTNEKIITKSKSSGSVFHLMITSDNSSEVLLVYYFMKAMILMFSSHLEMSGFKDTQFGGADLNFQQDFAPANIFHRNLSLNFNYNSNIKLREAAQDGDFEFQHCQYQPIPAP